MYQILPGILEKDWADIERKIELVKPFAKSVHIDIIDGKFAPQTTFLDPKPFAKYANELFLEVHLMVENPVDYLKPFAESGFKRFFAQAEKIESQEEFVSLGQTLGEVGLAIDAGTQLDIVKVPLEDLDSLFFMTVKAGFSGQAFLKEELEKIQKAKEKLTGINLPIEVDGGINDQTIADLLRAGVTRFVSTSFIFNSPNPQGQYKKLVSLANYSD